MPDSLTVPGCITSSWRHAAILSPRNCLLHDLISRVFLRSLQYGIMDLGLFDAVVYAHHKHRFDSANAVNFGDCLTGRVRFMTAINPAFAHAYQRICLAMHLPGVPHHTFRLPKSKSRYPYLPNDRSFKRELAMIIMDGPSKQMVVLALLMVKLMLKSLLDGV